MLISFITGFSLCFSLNCVIGAQNTYLFRQGLLDHYVFSLAFFCFVCDVILIIIGVVGMNILINQFLLDWLFGFSSICLFFYAILRTRSALFPVHEFKKNSIPEKSFIKIFPGMAILTLLNPHVYLDTVILIGSVSMKFDESTKLTYALGAFVASLFFFYIIAFVSRTLSHLMNSDYVWRILDGFTAIIMFIIGCVMLRSSNWF